jgi:hypothetical protein
MLEDYGSAKKLVRDTQLTEHHARLAEAYGSAYPEEIDEAIAENRGMPDELRELYPFIELSPARR